MTIALWCVLIAGLMPYVAVGCAKVDRGFDNNHPREWLATREGRAARAHAAHLNSFEALPLFAAGVLTATYLKASPSAIDVLAITFIAARLAYLWCYLNNHATARSVIWFIGVGATVGLFVAAAFAT